MRLAFITGVDPRLVKLWVCQETSPVGSLLPPVDLAGMAALARREGAEVQVWDLRLARRPYLDYQRRLEAFGPDAVVLNITTTSAAKDFELLAATPSRVPVIAFGTHAMARPEECFENGVRLILTGDPEAGLQSLLDQGLEASSQPGIISSKNPTGSNGPAYVEDLDSLPFPALEFLPLRRYRAPYFRQSPFTIMLSSRGCPHRCTFCLYPALFGRRVRERSPENICEEIAHNLKAHGVGSVYFLDATFNISSKRVESLCNEIIGRGLLISWICNMRVDGVTPHMLKLMRKAGCSWIFYGVEDVDLLDSIAKGITYEQTLEAFRMARKAGIATMAFLMLFPGGANSETAYEQKLLRLLEKLRADAFQCTVAIPFPGTPMYSGWTGNGKLSDSWEDYDPGGSALPYGSEVDLVRVKRNIYFRYFLRHPSQVLGLLRRINIKSLFYIAGRYGGYLVEAARERDRTYR